MSSNRPFSYAVRAEVPQPSDLVGNKMTVILPDQPEYCDPLQGCQIGIGVGSPRCQSARCGPDASEAFHNAHPLAMSSSPILAGGLRRSARGAGGGVKKLATYPN